MSGEEEKPGGATDAGTAPDAAGTDGQEAARPADGTPPASGASTPAKVVPPVADSVAQRLNRLRGRLSSSGAEGDEGGPSGEAPVPARVAAVPAPREAPVQAALPAPTAVTEPLPPQRAPALPPPQAQPQSQPRPRPASTRPPADTVPAPAILLPVTKRPLLRRGRKRISSSRAALLSMTSQEAPLAEQHEERDLLELCEVALMRLASIAWLAAAVLIWGRLIGYGGAAPTMSWHSLGQAFVPTLVAAIVMPIVSVGLWLVASWGAVIWAAAVLVSFVAALLGIVEPPFGVAGLLANLAGLAVVGTIAGVRAWRDRDFDD